MGVRLVATDFFGYYRPSECGLRVWLRAKGVEEAAPGPFAELLMRLGREHESAHLLELPSGVDLGEGTITERVERTRAAVAAGERLIYQGALRAETALVDREVEVVGVPDFMLLNPYGYAIRDSKLARSIGSGHPEIRLQLELYGWLFEQTFGEPPVSLQIHNGADEIVVIPYEGGDEALKMLDRILRLREQPQEPDLVVGWSKCSGCGYFQRCWPMAERSNSVGLLPGVDVALVSELQRMGVRTIGEIGKRFDADALGEVERRWGRRRVKVGERVSRQILARAEAFMEGKPVVLGRPAIPLHANYVMFDLEGMPPRLDELEKVYLWGLQVFGQEEGGFTAATADFGPSGDRRGWEAFLSEAESVLAHYGDIPFVHWASYERTKIDLYVRRFGDRDGVAERVKRNLLDLLAIAQESVALPVPSYGLKQVEGVAGFRRTLDEFGGDWSMARYIEATETNNQRLRGEIMDEILAYNREDLEATWAVLQWLREFMADG